MTALPNHYPEPCPATGAEHDYEHRIAEPDVGIMRGGWFCAECGEEAPEDAENVWDRS